MTHEELLVLLEHHHTITDDNIVGVGYGWKMVNNLLTEEKSIVFTVKNKLPLEELSPEQLLPSSLSIGEETIKTDVIQGEYKVVACDPAFYDWQTTPPINQDLIIPIEGGIQAYNRDAAWSFIGTVTGTIGMLAKDDDSNSLVAVTNNHVFCADGFLATDRGLGFAINTEDNIVETYTNIGTFSSEEVGVVKKYYPLRSNEYNYIDVATSTIEDTGIATLFDSYKQLGLSTDSLPFASTGEIDNILTTNPLLYSTGRTTGAKGEGITKLRVWQFPVVATIVGYWLQTLKIAINFSDLIAIGAFENASTPVRPDSTGMCPYPVYKGDSGSAVIADFGGTKKIIGLVFAGGSYDGLVCRIDRIAAALNLSAWNGEAIGYSDPSSTLEYTVTGLSSDVSLVIGGKTYWQIGTKYV